MKDTADDILRLRTVGNLYGLNFFIPKYQRGYRWDTQQVTDLLEDLWEFHNKPKKEGEIYCIQPLVVKRLEEDIFKLIKEKAENLDDVEKYLSGKKWEVIDGQQRLTTLYIILSILDCGKDDLYNLEYATRTTENRKSDGHISNIGSKEFLVNLRENVKNELLVSSNIDFYHIYNSYVTVENWINKKKLESGENNLIFSSEEFLETIKNKVEFIWYETTEKDPIDVFTRLNIGKIGLTDSELIKALFLNQSNFNGDQEQIRLKQTEIANDWDQIENALQNDEFWLFLKDLKWSRPTRIEWIFDLIYQNKIFGNITDCGGDNHKTFRYFYELFKINKKYISADWIQEKWNKIKKYYMIFNEWYNDFELYHYIGFLILRGKKVETILKSYEGSKDKFMVFLKDEIRKEIKVAADLTRVYENGEKKTDCFPLLLLFNIQTLINQNKEFIKERKYGIGAYYRFPFHLFKKEASKKNHKGWEVEHIASNSGDDLKGIVNQKIWLTSVLYCLPLKSELATQIKNFIDESNPREETFTKLHVEIKKLNISPLEGDAKQKIWNFALLDSSTNEEYQNDPFPIKRICVLAKEQGRKARVCYDATTNQPYIDRTEETIAFVPPCTKDVFIKAYTDMPDSMNSWTLKDARAYLRKMEETLMEFLYPKIYELEPAKRKILFNKDRVIAEIDEELRDRYYRKYKK